MTTASLAAYDAILPELPDREKAVLQALLNARDARGDVDGPAGMTNREIAKFLGLDRDSISPRTSKLRQKGLVVEAGISGRETLYEAAQEPNFVKAPGKRKPKAYYDGVKACAEILNFHLGEKRDPDSAAALQRAHDRISEILK